MLKALRLSLYPDHTQQNLLSIEAKASAERVAITALRFAIKQVCQGLLHYSVGD
jgi:hypothetical protein